MIVEILTQIAEAADALREGNAHEVKEKFGIDENRSLDAFISAQAKRGIELLKEKISLALDRNDARVLLTLCATARERALNLLQKEMPTKNAQELAQRFGKVVSDLRKELE